jgi:hypothetical protein
MSRRNRPPRKRPLGPTTPTLVSLADTVDQLGRPVLGNVAESRGDPEANLREFVGTKLANIGSRSIGTWEHLIATQLNVLIADSFIRDIAKTIDELGGHPSPRAEAAGVNVITGSNMVHASLILHLRPEPFNDRASLSLARTALECAGRAAAIAVGTKDEVNRWEHGPQFRTDECNGALALLTRAANASASLPENVYSWLCNFTHMNWHGVNHIFTGATSRHEDTYAAMAYVGWALAVVSERIVGFPAGVQWPVLPHQLPWK